jgi:hypothetical protein
MMFLENPSNRIRDTDEKVDCPPRKVPLFIDPPQKRCTFPSACDENMIYEVSEKSVQGKPRYSRKYSL